MPAWSPPVGARPVEEAEYEAGRRRVRPTLEAAIAFQPDVVVRYWGGDARLLARLEARGARVVTIADATDFAGIRTNIRAAARAFDAGFFHTGDVVRQGLTWRNDDGSYGVRMLPVGVTDWSTQMLRSGVPGTMGAIDPGPVRLLHVSTDYGATWEVRVLPGSRDFH